MDISSWFSSGQQRHPRLSLSYKLLLAILSIAALHTLLFTNMFRDSLPDQSLMIMATTTNIQQDLEQLLHLQPVSQQLQQQKSDDEEKGKGNQELVSISSSIIKTKPRKQSLLHHQDPQEGSHDRQALTSLDSVGPFPFRSEEDMRHAQACFRTSPQGYAYFIHMRKGGGTSMRSFLNKIAEQHPSRTIYVSEGMTFNVTCFGDQGELVVLTILRHPIDRIISSYRYEARKVGLDLSGPLSAVEEAKLLADGPGSLSEYVAKVRQREREESAARRSRRVWVNVDNYYIKTLTNRYRKDLNAPITRQDFELAKRIVAGIDVVLLTKWISWSNQTDYLDHVLGASNLRVAHENKSPGSAADRVLKKEEEKEGEAQTPEEDEEEGLDQEVMDDLMRSNYWDILLFEYAENLTSSRIAAYLQAKEEKGRREGGEAEEEAEASAIDCKAPINDPNFAGEMRQETPPEQRMYQYLSGLPQCIVRDPTTPVIVDLLNSIPILTKKPKKWMKRRGREREHR